MVTNDIVGNAHDETGRRDASTVRLFAEGVPAGKETSGFGNPYSVAYDTKRREILVPN